MDVSLLGLGGFHLGQASSAKEAAQIVDEALAAGVNFFDNAWEYNDGRSEEWLGQALTGKRDRAVLMTKVCTHGRGRAVAMQQLEESLKRLRTDHLDVWQVHECVYENDYKMSLKFDNPEARLAHDFPVDAQQLEIKEDLAYAAGKASAK